MCVCPGVRVRVYVCTSVCVSACVRVYVCTCITYIRLLLFTLRFFDKLFVFKVEMAQKEFLSKLQPVFYRGSVVLTFTIIHF